MMPLTDAIPKPMAPYRGSTLIANGIAELQRRIAHIHITIGYKKAMLAPHVIENGVSSILNTENQSNSWWIYNSLLSSLDKPMFVLTCDNIVEFDVDEIESDYLSLGSPPCMLVPVRPVPGLEGDFVHHENGVVSKVDRFDSAELYCSGIQVINPRAVCRETTEGRDFYDVWNQLNAKQQLKVGQHIPNRWFAVDTLE